MRQHDGQVVFTRDWHPAKTPHFSNFGGQWPVHCVAGTTGASFHDKLNVQPDDIIINKGMGQTDGYSGWEGQSDTGETLETIITPTDEEEALAAMREAHILAVSTSEAKMMIERSVQ